MTPHHPRDGSGGPNHGITGGRRPLGNVSRYRRDQVEKELLVLIGDAIPGEVQPDTVASSTHLVSEMFASDRLVGRLRHAFNQSRHAVYQDRSFTGNSV